MTGAADEINELARDLGEAPRQAVAGLRAAFLEAGEGFRDDWKQNATETAGKHGRHYPNAITTGLKFAGLGIAVETGPESGRQQGGMGPGFEFGSENQPPHLDGLRAMPAAERILGRLADEAIAEALP